MVVKILVVVGTIFMDHSRAFYCIHQNFILYTLSAYKLDLSGLSLIQIYLTYRRQKVKIDSTLSSWLWIVVGASEGSILTPLLFNIFLNDLLQVALSLKISYIVDDDLLPSCGSFSNKFIANLESHLNIALSWFLKKMILIVKSFTLCYWTRIQQVT